MDGIEYLDDSIPRFLFFFLTIFVFYQVKKYLRLQRNSLTITQFAWDLLNKSNFSLQKSSSLFRADSLSDFPFRFYLLYFIFPLRVVFNFFPNIFKKNYPKLCKVHFRLIENENLSNLLFSFNPISSTISFKNNKIVYLRNYKQGDETERSYFNE